MRYTPMAVAAAVTLAAFVRFGPGLGLLVGVLALGVAAVVLPTLERRRVMALAQKLSRRRLFGALGEPGGEKALLERLRKSLESSESEPSEVLYAVDLLEKLGQPPDAERLKSLLEHPSPEVRRAMVERAHALSPLRDAVGGLVEHDPSPDVRAEAARALCASGDITDLETLGPLLNPRFPTVREGAIVGLLTSRSVESVILGTAELERLQTSASRDDRRDAARVLGRVGEPRLLPRVEALLADNDPMVRRHALDAAACYTSASARLAPPLLKALSETRTAASAASALIAHGAAVVQKLAERYASATTSEDTARRILSIAGRIGGTSSERFLWDVAERGPIDHRRLALRALVQSSARADSGARSRLRAGVEKELDAALWVLAARRDLETEEPEGSLLMASLGREIELLQERLSHMLSLLGLEVDEAATEQELEALFGREAATALLVLLSRGSAAPAEALNALRAAYPQRMMSGVERLRATVARSAWLGGFTRAIALYRLAEIGDPEIPNVVAEGLSDASPFVRETAVWAASRANDATSRLEGLIVRARDDDDELVSRIARQVELDRTARPGS